MGYSANEMAAVHGESQHARRHRHKLAKITEIVEAHCLKKMKNFEAREQVATWRRAHDFYLHDTWVCGVLPLSPEEFTANLWSEVDALK